MDAAEFRKRGKEMVDYIADYMENIHTRRVLPEVQPGYLREMLPNKAPQRAEHWKDVMRDVDKAIMPGVRAVPGHGCPKVDGSGGKVVYLDFFLTCNGICFISANAHGLNANPTLTLTLTFTLKH